MKRHILLVVLNILVTMHLFGQQENKNAISLAWGMGSLSKQDLILSPAIHEAGSPLNILVTYEKSNKLEQQVSIRYGNYKARLGEEFSYAAPWESEPYPTYPHNLNIALINYSLGKSVLQSELLKLSIGGRSRNRFDISDFVFGFSGTVGNYLSLGFDAWINVQYDFHEKHRLISNIGLPIFAYVYRSPYLSQNDEYFEDIYSHNDIKGFLRYFKRGEIQSWNKSQNLDFDLKYYYNLSERWDIGAMYLFSINLNQKPLGYASIENVLFLSANFKLHKR